MRTLLPVLCCLALLVSAGCATSSVPATRSTPEGTVEVFKRAASSGNSSAEWAVLSPSFKDRLSRRAGRNVDEGDYKMARDSMRGDARVKLAEQLLKTARVTDVRPVNEDTVETTIVAGPGGPLGKTINARMVRIVRWRLFVKGDPEPYSGYVGDPLQGIERTPGGGYVVWNRPSPNGQKQRLPIPANEVESFQATKEWFVDGLGEMEKEFFQ